MQNTPTSFEPFSSRSLPKPSHRRTLSVANTPGASRDSSLQKVWADDYYADDFAGGISLSFEQDIPSPPAPATLPRSIPLSAEEESEPARQPRTHQRSLTDLLPFQTPRPNSKSPERSPVKQKIGNEFMSTLTGDRDGVIRVADKSKGGLASWFTGSSAPVALGVPVGEKELPPPPSMSSSRSTSPERQPGKLQKRPNLQTLDSTSRNPQDPFSPASFKNLLMNAEGILLKLQTAYKLRTLSLHELSADKSAITDELEEASTRATCLRTQLEDMASKVSEQDAKVADLTAQLEREKRARAAEKEAREKSIALIQANARDSRISYNEVSDILNEDLGISNAHAKPKKWRGSADLSTEGDSDTESESVFSRSRSPTLTTASVSTMGSTPELGQAEFARINPNINPTSRPRISLQQKSTFQKFLQGITPAVVEEDDFGGIGMGVDGCTNCRGKDASVAWDTVGLLRAENKGLKEQVGVLEGGVDGALALCYTMSHSE
ncbi:hypothetical protein LARI1_G005267 [Lachnellula arida]|uniref:Uncharacterized protein n=1 Tax=Lachnellula arida TaxID=1316785 RepID=A0A8T9BG83_9HELO|nr:hypothetical protein LARI1_G005267 [Lachnellula arida]